MSNRPRMRRTSTAIGSSVAEIAEWLTPARQPELRIGLRPASFEMRYGLTR